eukprot:COSAG02_NODE_2721_length_8165_cov_5.232333_3_plen_70_part_00
MGCQDMLGIEVEKTQTNLAFRLHSQVAPHRTPAMDDMVRVPGTPTTGYKFSCAGGNLDKTISCISRSNY